MNSIASKVWETLYPDRRPWDQLPEATQQEWSRMVDIVVDLTGARELRDALRLVYDLPSNCPCQLSNDAIAAWDDVGITLVIAKEVLG